MAIWGRIKCALLRGLSSSAGTESDEEGRNLVKREKRESCCGGGLFRIDFPGTGMVTAEEEGGPELPVAIWWRGRERVTSSSLSLNMTTSLDWLKQTGTIVVSDSGDFECTSPSFVSVLGSYHNSHRCLQTSGRYHEPFSHPRRCWQTRVQPSHRHCP